MVPHGLNFFKKSSQKLRECKTAYKLKCVVEIVNTKGFQKMVSFCVEVIKDIFVEEGGI